MKTRSEMFQAWSVRLRIMSYASGLAGMAIMVSDMGRTRWSYVSYVFLGIMVAGFMGVYVLSMLNLFRK